MIKHICDACGEEILEDEFSKISLGFKVRGNWNIPKFYDLCPKCAEELMKFLTKNEVKFREDI